MVDKSRRDRVGLGLIGLGPRWEQVYREPLVRLQSRLTIRLVYDPVEARSKSVAEELQAEAAGSLNQLLTRPTLQGLLILDPGWFGASTLNLVARSGKPTFLAFPVLRHASILAARPSSSTDRPPGSDHCPKAGDQLMPELGLRFTPASCRLRELIATKLGPAKQIEIECDLKADLEETAALVDWCSNIMGQSPAGVASSTNGSPSSPAIKIQFPSAHAAATSAQRTATLKQKSAESAVRIQVECERGSAALSNRTQIHWQTATESGSESLTDERTEVEILIDQFCRRALGGLNPIGRLSDFVRAMEVARSIHGHLR